MATLRPRQKEVSAMCDLLDQGAMLEDMAEAALKQAWDLVLARELFSVVTVYEDGLWVHGPYFSRSQAVKAVSSSEVLPKPGSTGRVFIRRIITSTAQVSDDDTLF